MSDCWGNALKITVFGESHGEAIGATICGIAAGVPINMDNMRAAMDKRRARGSISTQRHEADEVRFLSGVYEGYTTGAAICLVIENNCAKSEDYAKSCDLLRPSHADFTYAKKYNGYADLRGGGHSSGRLTAPIVAVGSIFTDILAQKGITIGTHILRCGGINDAAFPVDINALRDCLNALNAKHFAVINEDAGEEMQAQIKAAGADGDSVGAILETAIIGLPIGVGEPIFGSIESELSQLLFSIPAVKGVEFGAGFAFADMRASAANDAFCVHNNDIITKTNNNGGINGGISNGMPIIFRTVIKPTPSIYQKQQTVNYSTMQNSELQIVGRHDPCIAHRARVVQDSVSAIALAELLSVAQGTKWQVMQL